MKGWVGWPIADGLPTLVDTHQLQVEHRTGKVRQSETDVLPLCHATNRQLKYIYTFQHCFPTIHKMHPVHPMSPCYSPFSNAVWLKMGPYAMQYHNIDDFCQVHCFRYVPYRIYYHANCGRNSPLKPSKFLLVGIPNWELLYQVITTFSTLMQLVGRSETVSRL